MYKKGMRSLELFGLRLSTGSFSDAADFIVDAVAASAAAPPTIVTHLNVNNYYYLQKRADLKAEAGDHCVIVFDGIGMKIGALLSGKGWMPDLNGTDLFPMVMKGARRRRIRIFFLGASKEVLAAAVGEIEKLFGEYCVAGELRNPGGELQEYVVMMAILYDSQEKVVNFGDELEPFPRILGDDTLEFEICVQTLGQTVAR